MRILMTTDTIGGVWTYTRQLSEGLLANGCAVTLVSMGRWPTRSQQLWAETTAATFPAFTFLPTDFPMEGMQNGTGCYEESRDFLLTCIEMSGAQLLHSNQFCYGALPTEIPRLVVAHSDVLSWSAAVRGHLPPPDPWSLAYRDLVQTGLNHASLVIAPSEWMRQQLLHHYQLKVTTTVIYNGRTLAPAPEHSGRRMQAISCGRLLDEAKNIHLLEDLDTSLPLFVAGENTLQPGERPPASSRLQLLGSLSDSELHHHLCQSAIYIAPSLYEPFGLAPLEAALAGCALVLNDLPSFHEIWGDTALYFPHNDPHALSSLLNSLQQDYPAIHAAARSAGHRALERYSAEAMTRHYLDTYRYLLREPSSDPSWSIPPAR